jgi:hypothetical protein
MLMLMPDRYKWPEELSIGRLSQIAAKLRVNFARPTKPTRDKEQVMKPLYLTLLPVLALELATMEANA